MELLIVQLSYVLRGESFEWVGSFLNCCEEFFSGCFIFGMKVLFLPKKRKKLGVFGYAFFISILKT